MTAPLDPPAGKASNMSAQCAQPDCWQQLRSQVVGCHPLVERCHINVLCGHLLGHHDRAGIMSSSLVCVNTPAPPPVQPNVERAVVLLAVCIQGPCGLPQLTEVAAVVHATVAAISHVLVLLNGHDLPTWLSYSLDSTKTEVTLPEQPHREQCWISKNESGCLIMIEPNADIIVPMSAWRVSAPDIVVSSCVDDKVASADDAHLSVQPTLSLERGGHTSAGDSIPLLDSAASADDELASLLIWPEVDADTSVGRMAKYTEAHSHQYEKLPYVLATLGTPFDDIPAAEVESLLIWNSSASSLESSSLKKPKKPTENQKTETSDSESNSTPMCTCTSILHELATAGSEDTEVRCWQPRH
jgi:hypothetical protein